MAAVAAMLAAVVAADAGMAAVSDRVTHTLSMRPDDALSIAITNGVVRIEGGADRRDVRVDIERHAPSRPRLEEMAVVVTAEARGPHLQVEQAGGGRDPDLRSDLRLLVPRDVTIEAATVQEGRIDIRGVHGRVRAIVDRGTVVADDVSGALRLETTLGPIDVTRARLTASGVIRLRAFNGDVRLGFAAPLEDARVMALALNGTITSTLPLVEVSGWGPRWSQAAIGSADRVVSVDVVNGAIRIDAPR